MDRTRDRQVRRSRDEISGQKSRIGKLIARVASPEAGSRKQSDRLANVTSILTKNLISIETRKNDRLAFLPAHFRNREHNYSKGKLKKNTFHRRTFNAIQNDSPRLLLLCGSSWIVVSAASETFQPALLPEAEDGVARDRVSRLAAFGLWQINVFACKLVCMGGMDARIPIPGDRGSARLDALPAPREFPWCTADGTS